MLLRAVNGEYLVAQLTQFRRDGRTKAAKTNDYECFHYKTVLSV